MSIQDLVDDFEFLDEWEDRYRYVIELGKELEPLSEAEHSPANKVEGCVSQVWLTQPSTLFSRECSASVSGSSSLPSSIT